MIFNASNVNSVVTLRDHPFKTSAICRGVEVKNWSNFSTDSSKKLPTEGYGSKVAKICRRLKWKVPTDANSTAVTAVLLFDFHLLKMTL